MYCSRHGVNDKVSKRFLFMEKKGFALPAARLIKHWVLRRYLKDFDFAIETGTYLGESTKDRSQINRQVISIEPDFKLYS